ncbi:MAG: prolyl-tRNA synthetase associated domain-containing protein [Alphaproteobacteria bacterium]
MSQSQPNSHKPAEDLPTTPEILLEYLDSLDIDYQIFDHEPIFTVEEGEHLKKNIPGVHCRNLYLRDKQKNNYLLVLANETQVDLKKLPVLLDCGRLSFGSADRLWEFLGIRPGSVNPFSIMNDPDNKVRLYLDASMMEADLVNYHPMDNAQTIGLSPADLIRFIESLKHEYSIIDLSPAKP